MANPTLTPVTGSRNGTDFAANSVAATAGGDSWVNTGLQLFWIENAGGTTVTVTLVMQKTQDGQTPPNRTVAVAAAKHNIIGPFPTQIYNDVNGFMNVTYSGVTSVSVMAYTPATN